MSWPPSIDIGNTCEIQVGDILTISGFYAVNPANREDPINSEGAAIIVDPELQEFLVTKVLINDGGDMILELK